MFYNAYNGYLKYAYSYDELKPISCSGMDTWGRYVCTLLYQHGLTRFKILNLGLSRKMFFVK